MPQYQAGRKNTINNKLEYLPKLHYEYFTEVL